MKKLFASIFAVALVFSIGFGFSGCSNGLNGTYKVYSSEVMGLTATQKTFKEYSSNRTENDKNYNTLYKPLALIMNMKITISNDKNVKIVITDFESTLKGDTHYGKVLAHTQENGYLVNGDLVINDAILEKDNSEKDSYYIWVTDKSGEKQDLSTVFGDTTPIAAQAIHATIKDGKIAYNLKITVYEDDDSASGVLLTTTATIRMKK